MRDECGSCLKLKLKITKKQKARFKAGFFFRKRKGGHSTFFKIQLFVL